MCTSTGGQRSNALQLRPAYRQGALGAAGIRVIPCMHYNSFFQAPSDTLQFVGCFVNMLTNVWASPEQCQRILSATVRQKPMRRWANPDRNPRWDGAAAAGGDGYSRAHRNAAMAWTRSHLQRAVTGYELQVRLRKRRQELLSSGQHVLPDLIPVECAFTTAQQGHFSLSQYHIVHNDGRTMNWRDFTRLAGMTGGDHDRYFVHVRTEALGWPAIEPSLQLPRLLVFLKFLAPQKEPHITTHRRSEPQLHAAQQIFEQLYPEILGLEPLAANLVCNPNAPSIQAAAAKAEAEDAVIASRLAHAAALSNEQWQLPEYVSIVASHRQGPNKGAVYPGHFSLAHQHIISGSTGATMTPQALVRSAHANASNIQNWQATLRLGPDEQGLGGMKLGWYLATLKYCNAVKSKLWRLTDACRKGIVELQRRFPKCTDPSFAVLDGSNFHAHFHSSVPTGMSTGNVDMSNTPSLAGAKRPQTQAIDLTGDDTPRRSGKMHRSEGATRDGLQVAQAAVQAADDRLSAREARRLQLCTDEKELPGTVYEVVILTDGMEVSGTACAQTLGKMHTSMWKQDMRVAGLEFGIQPMRLGHFMSTLRFWPACPKKPTDQEELDMQHLQDLFPTCSDLSVLAEPPQPSKSKPKSAAVTAKRQADCQAEKKARWEAVVQKRRIHWQTITAEEARPETISVRHHRHTETASFHILHQCILNSSGALIQPNDYITGLGEPAGYGWSRALLIAPDQELPEMSLQCFLAALKFTADPVVSRYVSTDDLADMEELQASFPLLAGMVAQEDTVKPAIP
ncbi:hypothetical protein WJX73_002179 [Symbiochloris irregularis]|uniref:Uncharacterized protein n=1 Tax=Symbiochloris irregularis TaxID=706552 RepID=A0AAW1NPJ9_9CHLO